MHLINNESWSDETQNVEMQFVTGQHAPILSSLRQNIDAINEKKADEEARKYSSHTDLAAAIAYEGTNPIGYVEVKKGEQPPVPELVPMLNKYSELARIGVKLEARGKGVGKKLIETAIIWSQNQGCEGLWLEHKRTNTPAAKLYESCGFSQVGEFVDEKNEQRVVLAKTF